jgi:hypothetical protein
MDSSEEFLGQRDDDARRARIQQSRFLSSYRTTSPTSSRRGSEGELLTLISHLRPRAVNR